jgi:hypothetical protein
MKDITLHTFPNAGKYRVLLARNVEDDGPNTIHIHEHVENAEFSGFSRRGVQLSSVEEMKSLRDSLNIAISMLEVKV